MSVGIRGTGMKWNESTKDRKGYFCRPSLKGKRQKGNGEDIFGGFLSEAVAVLGRFEVCEKLRAKIFVYPRREESFVG